MESSEQQYLNLLRDILENGERRSDRTGTGTISVFGRQLRFDISQSVPCITTKRVPWKKVAEELLWFVRGDTHVRSLQEKGVHIWDANSSREFLDAAGLHSLPEGDIGPGYGHQWRRFGAEYTTATTAAPIGAAGFDQLSFVIDQLIHNPTSRRIFMSAWNPGDLSKMALPPCHVSAQFYVSSGRRLSCHMYQRSVDAFLGFPWNMLSYTMLSYLLAARTGLVPHQLIISTGDTHIYQDHEAQVLMQLLRSPLPAPKLHLSHSVISAPLHSITVDDFELLDYKSHPPIQARMSA